jgi:hypothetical protein
MRVHPNFETRRRRFATWLVMSSCTTQGVDQLPCDLPAKRLLRRFKIDRAVEPPQKLAYVRIHQEVLIDRGIVQFCREWKPAFL